MKGNNDSKEYMMSDFSKYCPSCKHKHLDKWAEPCATCFLMKGQINTDVPVYYEENSQMSYDKGLQLFADILFDKDKQSQFFEGCKALEIVKCEECAHWEADTAFCHSKADSDDHACHYKPRMEWGE